ncbi:MAG: hypothetical protein E2O78_07460 [Caldithrix sp.]|nr:MAG: hypothetical protein E2O78_07460 [Caldithrix sp.]
MYLALLRLRIAAGKIAAVYKKLKYIRGLAGMNIAGSPSQSTNLVCLSATLLQVAVNIARKKELDRSVVPSKQR